MNEHTFLAMGTTWAVFCDRTALLEEAQQQVEQVERRLSRFRPESALSRLNADRTVEDPMLASVVRAALTLRDDTGGAFDPTVGAAVVGLGYDRTFDELQCALPIRVDTARPTVRVNGDRVRLDGPGLLDLGGVAKGWTVDLLHGWLRSCGAREVLVDGGGDLKGSGRAWPIGVGPGWSALLDGDAIATSSRLRRRWLAGGQSVHHLVAPAMGLPADGPLETATVRAADAATADALATAVLVDPTGMVPRLPALGASALVQDTNGRWWTTAGWKEAA